MVYLTTGFLIRPAFFEVEVPLEVALEAVLVVVSEREPRRDRDKERARRRVVQGTLPSSRRVEEESRGAVDEEKRALGAEPTPVILSRELPLLAAVSVSSSVMISSSSLLSQYALYELKPGSRGPLPTRGAIVVGIGEDSGIMIGLERLVVSLRGMRITDGMAIGVTIVVGELGATHFLSFLELLNRSFSEVPDGVSSF